MSINYNHNLAERYNSAGLPDEFKKFAEQQLLAEIIGEGNGRSVLDVGTFTGRYLKLLAHLGYRAFGIDISEVIFNLRCKVSRERMFCIIQMSAEQLGFASESFDVVVCMMGTFAHLSLPARKSFLCEAHRILRPKGSLVISTWNPECSDNETLCIYTAQQRSSLLARSPSSEAMVALVRQVGYVDALVLPFAFLRKKDVIRMASSVADLPQQHILHMLWQGDRKHSLQSRDVSSQSTQRVAQLYVLRAVK
jgi:SAM-dependent methyltransferase